MEKCRCSNHLVHEHFIMRCRVCAQEYDVDFSPPLMCHDGDDDWEVEIIQTIGIGKRGKSVIPITDFSAI